MREQVRSSRARSADARRPSEIETAESVTLNGRAVLAHGENMQPYLYFFEDAVQVKKFIVFGRVSDQVKELLSGFGAEFQKPLAGFVR